MNKQKRLSSKVKKLGFCFVRPTGVRVDSQRTSCPHFSWAKNQSTFGRRAPDVLSGLWIKAQTACKVASVLLISHHFPLCLETIPQGRKQRDTPHEKEITQNIFMAYIKIIIIIKNQKTKKATFQADEISNYFVASANLAVCTLLSLPISWVTSFTENKILISPHHLSLDWQSSKKTLFTGKPLNQVLRVPGLSHVTVTEMSTGSVLYCNSLLSTHAFRLYQNASTTPSCQMHCI